MGIGRTGISRRQAIAGAMGAFAFRDGTLDRIARFASSNADPQDESYWLRIRDAFDIHPELIVFNHAGLSPSPRAVREAIAAETKRANQDPSYVIWRQQDFELDGVRSRLAKLLGCESDELALTMNATYGLQTGILGVPMEAGDRIVTTAHDYPRAITAIRQRERREKVVSTLVPISTPPEPKADVARKILDAADDRTKLVLLSQMTFVGGQIMPTREVGEALRSRGIPLFVDGAHGIGLLPDTVDEMGADLYTACLHKWLMGPIGTGVFVVKRPWLRKVWPLHPADPDLDGSARKFEQIGTRPAAPYLALKETLDFHEMIGGEKKAARLEALRKRLAEKLDGHPKLQVLNSLDPSVCRAVLLVGMPGVPAGVLASDLLTKHKIHVTTMVRAGVDALRISPSIFTSAQEIDLLAKALGQLAGD